MIRSELTNNASCLVHQNITQAIIGSFYEVYDELGHGFLESVYRESMTFALNSLGFGVEQEKTVKVCFRGHIVGIFRTDLVVEGAVVVELKCARTIDNMHEAQLLNYLKATEYEVGLLLNFGCRPQFRRMFLSAPQKRDRDSKTHKRSDASEL